MVVETQSNFILINQILQGNISKNSPNKIWYNPSSLKHLGEFQSEWYLINWICEAENPFIE